MTPDMFPVAVRELLRVQMFFTTLPLAFGVLHLLVFAAIPRLRSNLYYGLFLVFIAAAVFLDGQAELASGQSPELLLLRLHRLSLVPAFVFGLRFFYEVFLDHVPARYPYFLALIVITGVLSIVEPRRWVYPLEIAIALTFLDSGYVLVRAVLLRQEDAWLIALGYFTFVLFSLYDILLDFDVIPQFREFGNAYPFGLAGLVLGSSTFLARGIARTNQRLLDQERRVRDQEIEKGVLEAEVARTRAELEQARAFQLSMLPGNLPKSPSLELAVYMRTAMEVGGDYYDFRESPDGTLTIAVGDATGHGMRSGIMVALAKSQFLGLGDDEELPDFFRRCTRVLKPMPIGALYMALTLVRVRGRAVTVAAAGMPPLLVHRFDTDEVEDITLKGMPLGAFPDFPYGQASLVLEPGDTILLMTDGLMELFSPERELLGLDRVKAAFRAAARGGVDDVVGHLRTVADAWRNGHAQEDDLTLVVARATGTDDRERR